MVGEKGAANLLRRYPTLEAALADGCFEGQADELRLYRRIATMDSGAPLPPLTDQAPTFERAGALGCDLLVKGAYTEPEDRALPFGEPVDVAFVRLAHRLRAAGAEFSLATHHGVVREALLEALGPVTVEQVYGMRPEAVEDLTSRGVPVRLYVPFGGNRFRHWMRRLAEPRRA